MRSNIKEFGGSTSMTNRVVIGDCIMLLESFCIENLV